MGYYFSCMIAFNIIYFLRCLLSGSNGELFTLDCKQWTSVLDLVTMLLAASAVILGIICTICIIRRNDGHRKSEKGIVYNINEVEDITSESYLGKFSLLVLSAISLPVNKNILSLALYFIFNFSIAIIYIKKCLVYINPIITIFNYSIYKCKCERCSDIQNSKGQIEQIKTDVIFLVRGEKDNAQEKKIIRVNNRVCTKNFISKCYFINTYKRKSTKSGD